MNQICSMRIIALPRPNFPFLVDTYASIYLICCLKFQTQEDESRKPFGYCSRSLNDEERNYSTPERERLAFGNYKHYAHIYYT